MNGIVLIDKHNGISSNRVTTLLKHAGFGIETIGHGGTLDPLATGLLVVLVGRGAKLSEFVIGHDKTYRVTGCLGQMRDTFDATGKVTAQSDKVIGLDDLQKVIADFPKVYDQMPPAYSAIKTRGVTAYKQARSGKTPNLSPRHVEIYKMELLNFSFPEFELEVHVSSGTYIRSLIVDIAEKLGTLAYVSKLRRFTSGNFSIENAHTLEAIEKWDSETFWSHALPMETAVLHYPIAELSEEDGRRWVCGQWLSQKRARVEPLETTTCNSIGEKQLYRVHMEGRFIAMGYFERGILKPERVLLRWDEFK
jgi:tRNA pseudouridine55 synthase